MCARGVSASRPYLVMTVVFTPYVASASAAAEPAGPLPTTRTSVSRSGIGCPLLVARITSRLRVWGRPQRDFLHDPTDFAARNTRLRRDGSGRLRNRGARHQAWCRDVLA